MNNRNAYIIYIINCIVFIALETVAISMVSRSSVVQRSELMKAASSVSNTLSGATGSVTGYFSLGRVNNRLAQENTALRMENDRLRAALEQTVCADSIVTDDSLLFDYIPASVVSNSTDRLHNIIIINKGRRDGVKEDMGVITDRGIVGYVLSAGERYSKVSSMLDIDNMASAIHRRSNTFGVLQWNGAPRYLKVTLLSPAAIPSYTRQGFLSAPYPGKSCATASTTISRSACSRIFPSSGTYMWLSART